MKKFIKIFAYLFSLIIIISCEPGRDENGDYLFGVNEQENGGDNGGSSVTKLLKKATIDDEGDIVTFTYNYDAKKRLIGINTSDNSTNTVITYLENNNISSIVNTDNSSGEITAETIKPIYENGKITKLDKTLQEKSGILKSKADLTYHSNGLPTVISEKIYDQTNTNVVATYTSNFSYTGNNISKWDFKANLDFGFPIPIFNYLQDLSLTVNLSEYDNKINPFKAWSKDYLIASVHSEFYTSSVLGFAQNNAKKLNVILIFVGGTGEDTQQMSYTYDSDGYPLTGVSTYTKVTYEYQ
jgi:hypothetical protein